MNQGSRNRVLITCNLSTAFFFFFSHWVWVMILSFNLVPFSCTSPLTSMAHKQTSHLSFCLVYFFLIIMIRRKKIALCNCCEGERVRITEEENYYLVSHENMIYIWKKIQERRG